MLYGSGLTGVDAKLVFDVEADDSDTAMDAVDLADAISRGDKHLFDVGEALELIERLRLRRRAVPWTRTGL